MLRASQFRPLKFGANRPDRLVRPESLLDFIEGYTKWHHGVAPGYPEMMAAMRTKSRGSVHAAINILVDRGQLRRIANRARALEVIPRPKPMLDVTGAEWFQVVRVDGEARLVPLEGK